MASDPCVVKTICRAVLQMPGRLAIDKLILAQTWGHPDMALKFIKQSQDDATDLTTYDQLFMKALLRNQTTLVKEFITSGAVSLRGFLARGNVLTLYKHACKENRCISNAVQHHLGGEIMTLSDIGLVLQGLLESSGPVLYCSESADHAQLATMAEVEDPEEQHKADAKSLYRVPQTHLFIWCIVTNRRELARYFWNSAKEGTALALVAQQLLQELRELTEDSGLQRHLHESAQFFAKFATGYLDFLYRQDEERSRKLLVRVSEIAGQTTVLGLALKADNRGFVAHPACQSFMNAIWRGNIAPNTSKLMLLLTLFLPFMAGRVMRRRSKAEHVTKVTMETADDSNEDAWFRPESEKSYDLVNQRKESFDENESDCCACLEFYRTPVVKFISNSLFLMVFLLLFSIKLCCFFDRKFTWLDCLLLVWVFTLICQEIYEVVSFEGNTIICKIRDYISDVWNMMDVGSNVLFLVGFGLRYVDGCSQCLEWGRIVAGVSCTLYFVRLIDIFSVSKDIGPKIIMIGRMLKDLSAYALVLLVFVLGFGVVSQALLFPDSELKPSLLRDILQRPYFQIFGDHDLDELEGTNCKNGTNEVPCPDHVGADVITVFLAVYILLTNILVLNLIIAMFSFTVANIHENTNEVWHTQRYHVIRDYYHRPVLPPPLIILNHLYDLCVALTHCGLKKYHGLYTKLSEDEDDALVTWEHMHADDFVRCQVKGETEKH